MQPSLSSGSKKFHHHKSAATHSHAPLPPQVPRPRYHQCTWYLPSLNVLCYVNDTRHSQASSHCTEQRVFPVRPHRGRSVTHSCLWLNWTVSCVHGLPAFIHSPIHSLKASPELSSPVCHHSIASLDPSTSRASLLSTSVSPHSGCHKPGAWVPGKL